MMLYQEWRRLQSREVPLQQLLKEWNVNGETISLVLHLLSSKYLGSACSNPLCQQSFLKMPRLQWYPHQIPCKLLLRRCVSCGLIQS
nr:hypothetical protein Iba_chr02dCG6090 [Ipomoea batatas]GME09245.1 hypothetical protein Iba_scaffold8444CG0040 [Ipomoea batatas]